MATINKLKIRSGTNLSNAGTPDLGELIFKSDTNTLYVGDGSTAATGLTAIGGSATINNSNWSGTDLAVANGGTGASSFASNAILTGNGTSAIQAESTLTYNGSTLTFDGSDDGNRNIELGSGGNGTAFIDLIASDTYTDYSLRLIRWSGDNSTSDLVHRGTGDLRFITSDAANILWLTGGAEKMRMVHSTGNLGIGTNSPGTKLHVKQTGSASYTTLKLEDNARLMYLGRDAITVRDLSDNAAQLYINSNTTFSGTVTTNGNVTIGGGGDLILSDSGGGNSTFLYNDSQTLIGYINGAERFRFDSSGRMAIGHNNPWTSTVLDLGATSNNMRTGSKIYFYDSNKYIGRNGSDIQHYNNHGNHRFYRGSNEIARIDDTRLTLFGHSSSEGGELAFNPGTSGSYTTTFYLDSFQNKLRVHSGGVERFYISTDGTIGLNGTVAGSAVLDEDDMASDNPSKLASQQSIKAYVDANAGGSNTSSDGSAGTPAFNFTSDTNTGMYRVGSDALGFSVGGNIGMQITADQKVRIYQSDDTTDYLELFADDSRAHYHHSHTGTSGAYHRFITDNGYIELGPSNTGWGHINTDRAKFYFNKQITVDSGVITAYDEDLSLQRNHDSANDSILIASSSIQHKLDGNVKLQINSDGRVNYNGWTGVDHITVRSNGHTNSTNAATFYIKFCTVVVDNSPTHYNGLSLTGKLYRGDNGHGNWIDWSVWFNAPLDSGSIAHGGFMRSNGAHWISNIFVQRTGGDGEIDNGTCTYELYYDLNENWTNNIYNVATEVHYPSEGKFNVTWNHDQSEVTSLPGTEVINMQTNYYDDGNQTLVQTGAVGAPSYSFLAQRNTGMYGFTDNTIGFSCNGTRMLSIKADGSLELRSDGSSQGASIQRVGQIQFTWDRDSYGTNNNHAIVCDSDNLIINSYDDVTINLDSNNNDGAETFDIRRHATSLTGGELLFQIGGSGTSYTMGASQVGNGSASAPTLSFYNDTDTGIYRNAANQIGFSTGGERQMYLFDGGLQIEQPVRINFANDQRIFDNGSGGLSVGAESHELRLYSGGTDPIEFRSGGRNGTTRCMITYDGQYHWGSGAGHGTLTWDTGKAILTSQSGNTLELRSQNNTDMIAIETNQTRFIADGTERFACNQNGLQLYDKIVHNTTASRDKIRIWNSSLYAIGMDNAMSFGGLNDYAMTFQMNNEDDRGFVWLDSSHSDAQGAMALTTNGLLTVANKIRVGFGESDTTTPASHDIVAEGSIEAGSYYQVAGNQTLLRQYVSSWSNAQTHDVLYNAYQSNYGDYVYLKAAGNSANTHGMIVVADSYIFMGRDNHTTGALDNSATAPITDVNFRLDSNGNGLFDGDVVAFSTTIASDARLKENVKDLNYGLKDVLDIRPVSFDWKEKRDGQHDIGVIAQEIEKIIPEVVVEVDTLNSGEETHKTVDYAKLTSVLIKAVQEQQQQINELKEKLNG